MQKQFLSSRVTAPSRHPLNFSNFEVSHGNASTPDALDFIVCAVCWFNLFGFVKARGNPDDSRRATHRPTNFHLSGNATSSAASRSISAFSVASFVFL